MGYCIANILMKIPVRKLYMERILKERYLSTVFYLILIFEIDLWRRSYFKDPLNLLHRKGQNKFLSTFSYLIISAEHVFPTDEGLAVDN